ncbi:hypothetical protein DFH11DRAFT_1618920 [Phellopilus nigrolimitatus]|nr:hypothetical protein DFH11DRAFT_1618920 [Phellopilus nigrolimitatus]
MTAALPEPGNVFRVTCPFDETAQADMVLRSADGVDFRVMKGVLAVSSPIFFDMTSVATPSTSDSSDSSSVVSEEGLPVVVMYESNAVVLDALLRLLYPVVPPDLDDLDLLAGLLCAAQKYDMPAVLYRVKEELCELSSLDNGRLAMQVYTLACEYMLEDEARMAAWESLKYPLNKVYFPGLEKVSGSVLFRLFEYRQTVSDKIDVIFSPITSFSLPQALSCVMRFFECSKQGTSAGGCGSNEYGRRVSGWWLTLRETARSEIQKAPLSETVINFSLIAKAACTTRCCQNCQTSVLRSLPEMEPAIKHEITQAASEVKLTLPWK